MKLSVCMIIKDEEETIERCLKSMESFVDEYVIGIDDKSKDKSEEIINNFFKKCKVPNKVYKFKWENSFCKARNEGMDKATGDYILIVDGHEYFPANWYNITERRTIDVIKIMPQIKKMIGKEKPDEGYFQLYQQPFIGAIPNNFFLQPRVYRNAKKIRYNRDAHNTIVNTDPKKALHFDEVILIHDAPAGNRGVRSKQRAKMNSRALKDDLKSNPKDTRAMFYLANTLLEKGSLREAVKYFDKYLNTEKGDHSEKYQALMHKAIAHVKLNEGDKVKDTLVKAKGVDNLRRDAYMVLGDWYCDNNQYERGVQEYVTALHINPKPSRMFQNGPAWTYEPIRKLAMACEKLGDIKMAIRQWEALYRFLPSESVEKKIKKLRGDKPNVLIIDAIGSFTKPIKEYFEQRGCEVTQVRSYDKRLGAWADIIWQEWADKNAVMSSNEYPDKTIIRFHGYEWYLLKGELNRINWKCRAVFVAKHIKERVEKMYRCKGTLLYNGVDMDRFYIKNDKRDVKNIGYAGLINEKKNPFLMCRIIKDNPKYIFHIRADFQDPFWESAWKYELKDCKNIVYHGRYKDLSDFWNQMSGVLSTSIIESFSFNVSEAMACGCKPYIYNWEGAEDIWEKDWIYKKMPKFDKDVSDEDRLKLRKYIYDNYSIEKLYKNLDNLLEDKNE